ncbi:MAG: MBL fold metallo-hydrolase [Deltaproteobacteria bacterium]|nr:MBL fold metallo-hydrolase [Deltaproteobacteria bacterium]MBM4324035.1 MBL fold metallo-hydrolase [Deltaproteobacteria bacterium]
MILTLEENKLPELIVLGSGTGIPSLRRASPSLLLLSGNSRILIDSGPGALRKMLEAGVTYRDVDLLLYTHLHPDHTADLVPILFACKYGDLPREKELTCIGGPGFKLHFDKINDLYGSWINPQTYHLTIKEISSKPLLFGEMKILSKPMAHLPGSIGYRIEWQDDKSIVISGDSDYCENIVNLASETNLLVLECSFPDGKKVEGHLTPSLAGRIARESHCKRLLLTHLYPICDQHDILTQSKQAFQGEIILSEDLMRIEI